MLDKGSNMIIYKLNQDIFNSKSDAIVNTVNCVGVMGSGLAKKFKERYPVMYKEYRKKCEANKIQIGILHIFRTLKHSIINFPTKIHWKNNSKLEWIEAGLNYFVENYKKWSITSVAFPQLGTSNGKLDWGVVRPIMKKKLELINIKVEIYTCS